MANQQDYRTLLLSFVYTLTLCDHMGDVANVVDSVLKENGVQVAWSNLDELRDALKTMGIKWLYSK